MFSDRFDKLDDNHAFFLYWNARRKSTAKNNMAARPRIGNGAICLSSDRFLIKSPSRFIVKNVVFLFVFRSHSLLSFQRGMNQYQLRKYRCCSLTECSSLARRCVYGVWDLLEKGWCCRNLNIFVWNILVVMAFEMNNLGLIWFEV